MSRNVVTASPNTSFEEIWELIFDKRVSGIPIVDKKNNLLGIISEEDIIETLYPSHADYFFDPQSRDFEEMEKNVKKLKKLTAKDLMSKNVYTTSENAPILKAASSMLIYKVSCLPVVKEKGKRKKLLGIICKGDIFGHIFKSAIAGKNRK